MATEEGTRSYFDRADRGWIVPVQLGRTGFWISPIGFGGYRIHDRIEEHRHALRHALLHGVNLIDTSSNYADGGSERLIGEVLAELSESGLLSADEIVVVSKVGYVQGQNLRDVQERENQGRPFPEMVKYSDGCWHCIHPEFLEDQLARTLDRLRLPAVDVYLLHNPEYFLSDARKRGVAASEAREEYYRRIAAAFEWLEAQVRRGTIRAYGISSNTLPSPESDAEFTSLERLLELARSLTDDHHFRVIQFPMNLFEAGALFEKNQRRTGKTVVELAADARLGTLVNRPLNAIGPRGGFVRLASFRQTPEEEVKAVYQQQLRKVQEMEQALIDQLLPALEFQAGPETIRRLFAWGAQLSGALEKFQAWEQWDHVKQNVILHNAATALFALESEFADSPEWGSWSTQYAEALNALLEAITRHYENQAQRSSSRIADRLDAACPELAQSQTLSQKCLRTYLGVSGVDCVLLGMRRVAYVDDAFAAQRAGAVRNPVAAFEAFAQEVE